MNLRHDQSALESIPLRLMIVAVVVSMSIIPASEALETLRNGDFVRRAEAQLDGLIATVEVLAIEGPGGVRSVNLDFRSEGSLRFMSIVIGDSQSGPNASAVVLCLSNGGTMVKLAHDPPVAMSTCASTGLLIESSACCLRLACQMAGSNPLVMVESV